MKISKNEKNYNIGEHHFSLMRNDRGVINIGCKDLNTFSFAMGMIHAIDRPFQLELARLISQGRLCEKLKDTRENFEIDVFMRGLNFYNNCESEENFISDEARQYFKAYCEGVNYIFHKKKLRPTIFKLLKHTPELWALNDSMAITKLMSYVGLAQSQQDMEKFIIHSLRQGVDLKKLQSILSPHLDQITKQQVDLIQQLKIYDDILPNKISKFKKIPLLKGSNNWVVNSQKTNSSKPIHSFDPHLECNRLPAIWYEFTASMPDNYYMGINMPGVPGIVMGRSKHVSFSFTYGFMDTIDYFIEDIRAENYRDFSQYRALEKRVEIIKRKKKKNVEISFFHTSNGTVESNPHEAQLEDGYYLSRAWSGNFGAAGTVNALYEIHNAKNAQEMKKALKKVAISCNWLIADSEDNISYQQSGRAPQRAASGLFPLEGWIKENSWQGFINVNELSNVDNPECGYLVTANENNLIKPTPITVNLHMGPHRQKRIEQLLCRNQKLTLEDHQYIQRDLFSIQAQEYLDFLKEHLPSTSHTLALSCWPQKYDKNSVGASVFEKVYADILAEVFGEKFIGRDKWHYLERETAIVENYFHYFDRIILNPNEYEKNLWFDGKEPLEYILPIVEKSLRSLAKRAISSWGQQRKIVMKNIFYGETLSKIFKQNYGPVIFEGSRATVNHASIYKSHGRQTSFAPSYRFVSDMNDNTAQTILAGGQSEQKNSPYYSDQIEDWLTGRYKKIKAKESSL